MKPHARKTNWLLWLIILGAAVIVSYYISALFVLPGVTMDNFGRKILYAMFHSWPPWKYFNHNTGVCMLTALMIWVIAFSHYLANTRHYMFGREYGSADWADIDAFNKEFADWEDERKKEFTSNNRILSQNARISYDGKKTLLNNNQFVVGGSGSGKTAFLMSPNLLQFHGSNVYTDPKGGMLKDFGHILEKNGIIVKSINLCDMRQSIQYNPFNYIHTQDDLAKLITNLIANTTPAESHQSDPFWEKAEVMYLTAIFNYVWLECPKDDVIRREDEFGQKTIPIRLEKNFRSVLHLLDEASVPTEKGKKSPLTERMEKLAREDPRHERHPAVRNYHRCIQAAGDTLRSIIMCANSRFAPFDNEELLRILDEDETDLTAIGIGKDGDEKTQTAFFCIIPEEDKTYNFVIGMFYTQLIQELYRIARRCEGGRLPLDVGFWFDEFANIQMPSDFDHILSTCRSRGIYCTVVLQSLSQIKALYKDKWEGLIGDCDTFIYLGGFEASTHKYISEQLGKWTIDKRSSSRTYGSHGSSSRNDDILGRELMTQDEIATMDNNFCIVRVRGQSPIYDKKWYLFDAPAYLEAKSLGAYVYQPVIREDEKTGRLITIHAEEAFRTLDKKSLAHYKEAQKRGENVKVISVTEEQLDAMNLDADEDELEEVQKALQGAVKKQAVSEDRKAVERAEAPISNQPEVSGPKTLMDMLAAYDYSDAQIREIRKGVEDGLDEMEIMMYADVRNTAEKMRRLRMLAMQKMG